ncbi:hypothetical protein NM688_g1538 [Phlebia brevispora]|uniref:Uncharacterized protein n=1 Tax=Phlebia brevispora TaxID=194682 RepID=A0ACC1TB79_9APHY|nr:hypothetical protein NM688_g1538 [Phlebia brevispora]
MGLIFRAVARLGFSSTIPSHTNGPESVTAFPPTKETVRERRPTHIAALPQGVDSSIEDKREKRWENNQSSPPSSKLFLVGQVAARCLFGAETEEEPGHFLVRVDARNGHTRSLRLRTRYVRPFLPLIPASTPLLEIPVTQTTRRDQMSTDIFPFDVIEHVAAIVYYSDDDETLRACVLVSRTWWIASRLYVFRRIRIVSEDRLNSFAHLLQSDPSVGPLVRGLVIQPDTGTTLAPSEWIAKFPSTLSSKLIHLHAIELVQLCEMGEYILADFFHEFAKFETVSRLTVRDSLIAMRMILAFASALPRLRDFRIGMTREMPTNLWDAPPNLLDPSLTYLELKIGNLYSDGIQESLTWALSSNSLTTLQSLNILVFFGQAKAVMDGLNIIGSRLHHLELDFGLAFNSPLEYEMIKDELNLRPCTALHSLALRSKHPDHHVMVSFLTELSSPDIQKITFRITVGTGAPISNCGQLRQPLDGNNLRGLQEVCFIYEGGGPNLKREDVANMLAEALPSIASRGILRVIIA